MHGGAPPDQAAAAAGGAWSLGAWESGGRGYLVHDVGRKPHRLKRLQGVRHARALHHQPVLASVRVARSSQSSGAPPAGRGVTHARAGASYCDCDACDCIVQAVTVRCLQQSTLPVTALSSALQGTWQVATVEFTKDNPGASR